MFVPAGRIAPRPVGTRVHLDIELRDRTVAYSGPAVVSEHVDEPTRSGLVLSLVRPAPAVRDVPAPEVTLELDLPGGAAAAPAPAATSAPEPRRGPRAARTLWLAAAAAAALVAAVAGGAAFVRAQRRAAVLDAAFSDAIRVADERLRAGRLVAPGGDSALDHLLAARALRPGDTRVLARLEMMADTFESLGRRAMARGDLQEAAAHLSGVVRADPGRDWARAELERVESRRRAEEVRRRRGAERGAGASG